MLYFTVSTTSPTGTVRTLTVPDHKLDLVRDMAPEGYTVTVILNGEIVL